MHAYVAALVRELHGVGEQVQQGPVQLGLVGQHQRRLPGVVQVDVDADRDVTGACGETQVLGHVLDQPGHVDRLEHLGAALHLAEIQELLDEGPQPRGVAAHHHHHLGVLGVDLVPQVLGEQLQVARDARQRGAQLVRDVGDELRLHRVDLQQALLHLLLHVVGARVLLGHLVHGTTQAPDLRRSGHPRSRLSLSRGQAVDHVLQVRERPPNRAHHPPAHEPDQQRPAQTEEGDQRHGLVEAALRLRAGRRHLGREL